MAKTFQVAEELSVLHCPSCGMLYAAPTAWRAKLLEQHDRGEAVSWCCPAGHSIVFSTESELDRVRRERDRLKQDTARLECEALDFHRRAIAAESEVERQKTRSAAGVCPCCHRTFRQLALHMKTKHPVAAPKLKVVR